MDRIKKTFVVIFVVVGLGMAFFMLSRQESDNRSLENDHPTDRQQEKSAEKDAPQKAPHPMSIEAMRQKEYPGGNFVIDETLSDGSNYRQFVVSYRSEGLKIYGLLTVPLTPKPETGFPAIVFVHGHIPPRLYSTIGSYPSYQATLAKSGMITFKPDLRGHGRSEGEASGAHFSPDYLTDILYAVEYLKNYESVDPERLGYWGHSNGGETGLRVAVISSDIKAYSLWAGVVGSFVDHLETWNEKIPFMRNVEENELVRENGLPSANPDFWQKIDPYHFLADITAPIQLQHATGDKSVPIELSQHLNEELQKIGKKVEYVEYEGDDHNIGANSGLAWQRTIEFFRNNL